MFYAIFNASMSEQLWRPKSEDVSWEFPQADTSTGIQRVGIIMKQRPNISVVVPCFNEAAVLREFYLRCKAACQDVSDSYEIVLVDDGSTDGTFDIMREFTLQPGVVAVKLLRNHGHQAAATAGLSIAGGERVLLIDADLQDPPELLADMMRLMDDGADVVYGHRTWREGETRFKTLTASLFYRLLSRLSATPIPKDTGDFRLMRRKIVDALDAMPEQQRFIRGMVSWVGGIQVPIDYVRSPRAAGTTKYPLIKMIRFASDAITSFSIKPLRVAIWMAMMVGAFAVLLLAYTIVQWIDNGTVPGWTSLMTALCIFSSLQFLLIGVVGEYVGRLFIEMKQRPLFLVDEILKSGTSARPPMELSMLNPAERRKILEELEGWTQVSSSDGLVGEAVGRT